MLILAPEAFQHGALGRPRLPPQSAGAVSHSIAGKPNRERGRLLAALGPRISVHHLQFSLVREDREVTVEAVKQVALGLVRCEVADESAFGCVFSKLFDLRQIVLHRRGPPSCSRVSIWKQRE